MSGTSNDVSEWWSTAIIDMVPGRIRLRGRPIEELIGTVTFPQMVWLMTRGNLPTEDEAALLECALVAAVDHGPQAPSIAAARMAVTCGLGLNGHCQIKLTWYGRMADLGWSRRWLPGVLSEQFEPVSAGTMTLNSMAHQVDATRRGRRCG